MTPDQQIAAYIRRHGVTRCPTAAVAPTTGTISTKARQALEARPQPAKMTFKQRRKAMIDGRKARRVGRGAHPA